MDLGWQGLTPAEQQAAIYGGTIGFGFSVALASLFGGLHIPRRRKRSRKRRRR